MSPIVPQDVLVRCKKQTSDLFDIFLKLDMNQDELLPKRKLVEHREVYSLERDSSRAPPLKSSNQSSPILSRSPGIDARSYHEARREKEKRRSLDLAKRYSYGSTPPSATSSLQRDHIDLVTLAGSSERSHSTTSLEREEVQRKRGEEAGKKRYESGTRPKYEEYPDEQAEQSQRRSRAYSVGPTEEQIREAALTIASVGDKIEEEYGSKLRVIERELCEFVRKAGASLTYEVFAAHVNDLVEHDRNWTNFMFVMHLGKRVVNTSQTVGSAMTEYFRRFVGDAFAEQIANQNDVVTYIRNNTET